ncbi:Atlastin-1 [Trichoplax sp. H2]|nr:Atlastin-1 [Trichoplax sp. H2]|eukprot:RDD47484.1 Atlastin-1 [Trichoplax sp. H2]
MVNESLESKKNNDQAGKTVQINGNGHEKNHDAEDNGHHGKPVQIVISESEHSFRLNETALENILLQSDIQNKKVVVISVAGAYRKGKSFLLDFFLRYLERNNDKTTDDWLGKDDEVLTGFPWRGGSQRETTGILLWDKPFLCELPDGEEVVVLIMDTQGAFDKQSTIKDCAVIFALSTMISSVQIYNISQNIQEDHLQHLQIFTEYGRVALEDNNCKPFQVLQFLVRDWSYPYEYPYGEKGGADLLKERLEISPEQHEELRQLRQHIHSCYEQLNCFLMPHPGFVVSTNPNFKGRLSDIQPEFRDCVKSLVGSILAPENLIVKKISGCKLTCKDLLNYFKAYMEIYQGDGLPDPKSMFQATAEASNVTAYGKAKEYYSKEMDKICGPSSPFMKLEILKSKHEDIKVESIKQFKTVRKMGGDAYSQKYLEKLTKEIDEAFERYEVENESKNVLNIFRTPITLAVMMVVLYLLSGILEFAALRMLSNLVDLCTTLVFFAISLWSYIRYTGKYTAVGGKIDDVANAIWEQALESVMTFLAQKSTEALTKNIQTKKNQ